MLALDALATPASVERAAYCAIDGVGERVPVRVLAGDERAAVLEQRRELGYSYYQILWKDGVSSTARVRDRALEDAEAQLVVVACKRALPPDAKMQLVWGAGIEAASGIATTLDQKLAFQVRPAFTARVQCERVNARAGCIPLQPIRVQFSAPVPVSLPARRESSPLTEPRWRRNRSPAAWQRSKRSFSNRRLPRTSRFGCNSPRGSSTTSDDRLANADRFPLELKIDSYPPLAKFAGSFGILESNEGAVLPVTLRNVEVQLPAKRAELTGHRLRETADVAVVAKWMQRVDAANSPRGTWSYDEAKKQSVWTEQTADQSVFNGADSTDSFTVPVGVAGAAEPRPFEVVGIPLAERGFYVVELESRAPR